LLVTARLADGSVRDVTDEARFAGFDSAVIQSHGAGYFSAVGNGEAAIEISYADPAEGKTYAAKAKLTASGCESVPRLHFARDAAPVLSKLGCNSGGCHGKGIGQNGFKLSLFAFDPAFDHAAIVHESRGRRVSAASPEDSLLLRKATAAVAHGGGARTQPGSAEYETLRLWIAAGAPWIDGKEGTSATETASALSALPEEVELKVFPARRTFDGPGVQRLRVVVRYADGSERDVTRLSRYDSQSPEIVTVAPDGRLQATGATGEGYVMIRYSNLVATATALVPLGPALPDEAYAGFSPKNFVDERLLARWKELHIAPGPEADDAEFLRRVYLDVLGKLPTPDEARAFLADTSADKRDRLIDTALDRPEHADLAAQHWGAILRNRVGDSNAKDNTLAFHKWIRDSVAEGKPYDRFVREILTATGKRSDQPQMDWWRQAISHPVRVEDSAQAFLGMRVSCANCHNHPFENVSQTDYWRYAAFFAKVDSPTYGSVDEIKYKKDGKVKHPRTDEPLTPKAFGGPAFEYVEGKDPRTDLVDWMTSKDNPYFAKAFCNRVWGHYMTIGLVDPVDDMRSTNPPAVPDLLDDLARDFVENGFDMKRLAKTILKSRAYGLSSEPTEGNQADARNYARAYPQRLAPHVLYDALHDVTGAEVKFDDYPEIKRATLLPNEKARSDFLDMFGRSRRDTPCECETDLTPNLGQTMYLLHSEELQRMLSRDEGYAATLAKSDSPDEAVVDELFLTTFSRNPTDDERQDAAAHLASASGGEDGSGRRQAIEDLLWTLLNSKEFIFRR
jgi:hypothetical protein